MDITSIFKQGLKYPLSNYVNLIIVGILLTVSTLILSLGSSIENQYVIIIGLIIGLIITIILEGYKLDVINHGINSETEISLPKVENFVGGIKSIIVSIIYFIIPAIVVVIVAVITGASAFNKLINASIIAQSAASNPDVINMTVSTLATGNATSIDALITGIFSSLGTIFSGAISSIFNAVVITLVVAIVLFIIFGIFASIATARLAETGSIGSALKFGEIISKVGSIGWGKVILYIIILAIISVIINLIASIIVAALLFIPVVGVFLGVIVAALIFAPFVYLFQYYSLGLLYSE